MNIEQRIKAIKNFAEVENPQSLLPDLAKQSLEVINHLQSEVERYKSLWEANAAESEEIIAELKTKDEWQPIETCPEEKYVFVWGKSENNPEFGKRYEAYKKDDRFLGYSISTLNIYEDMIYFTHWRPLPKPPEQNH